MSSDDHQAPEGSPSIKDLAKAIFPDDPMAFDEYRAKDALKAVEALGDDEAVDFLANEVLGKHPDQYTRSAAAMSLGRLGNPRAASALKKALNDPSTANVVPAVRFALGELGVVGTPAPAPASSPPPRKAPTQGGFFSRLFGGSKAGAEESVKRAASQIEGMLQKAGPTTLSGCRQVLSVTILHQKPMLPDFSARKIAGMFLQQYKRPGWIPEDLFFGNRTAVEAIHRENAAGLSVAESNSILAESLARAAKRNDLDACAAITFSGDNQALGYTFFSILAK